MPRSQFNELNLSNTLTETNIVFRAYTQDTFVPDEKVRVDVQSNKTSINDNLYVVPDWIRHLGINLNELDETSSRIMGTNSIDTSYETGEFMKEFSNVFEQRIVAFRTTECH